MKRIFTLLIVLLPFVSCQKETPAAAPEADTIFVTINNFATKAQIGTDQVLKWSENDKVAVMGDSDYVASEFQYSSGAGYTTAAFKGYIPEGETFIVCHPSTAKCDGTTFRGVIDTKVTHKMPFQELGSLPLWGKTKDLTSVSLTSPCGILKLNLKGTCVVKSIRLDAGKPVSGEFFCNLENSLFAMVGGSNLILMEAGNTELVVSEYTPFYFILPPGEYDTMQFNVTDTEGEVAYLTIDKNVTITPGKYTSLSFNINE